MLLLTMVVIPQGVVIFVFEKALHGCSGIEEKAFHVLYKAAREGFGISII